MPAYRCTVKPSERLQGHLSYIGIQSTVSGIGKQYRHSFEIAVVAEASHGIDTLHTRKGRIRSLSQFFVQMLMPAHNREGIVGIPVYTGKILIAV